MAFLSKMFGKDISRKSISRKGMMEFESKNTIIIVLLLIGFLILLYIFKNKVLSIIS